MPMRRIQDRIAKRSTRVINVFLGSDYSAGKTRQRDQFAYVCDFQFVHKKPWLRQGKAKMQLSGFSADIDSLFNIRIGGLNLIGQVQNGTLTTYPKDDDVL